MRGGPLLTCLTTSQPAAALNWEFTTQYAKADAPAVYWGLDDPTNQPDYSGNNHAGIPSGGSDPQSFEPGTDDEGSNKSLLFKGAGTLTSDRSFPSSNTFSQVAWIKTKSRTGGFIMGMTNPSEDMTESSGSPTPDTSTQESMRSTSID